MGSILASLSEAGGFLTALLPVRSPFQTARKNKAAEADTSGSAQAMPIALETRKECVLNGIREWGWLL